MTIVSHTEGCTYVQADWLMKINQQSIQQAARELLHDVKELSGRLKDKFVIRSYKKGTYVAGKAKGRRPEGKPLKSRRASPVESSESASVRPTALPSRRDPLNNYVKSPELILQDLKGLDPSNKEACITLRNNFNYAAELMVKEKTREARELKAQLIAEGRADEAGKIDMPSKFVCLPYICRDLPVQAKDINLVVKLREMGDNQLGFELADILRSFISQGVVIALEGAPMSIFELQFATSSPSLRERNQAAAIIARANVLNSATAEEMRQFVRKPERLNIILGESYDLRKTMKELQKKLPALLAESPNSIHLKKTGKLISNLLADPVASKDVFAVSEAFAKVRFHLDAYTRTLR